MPKKSKATVLREELLGRIYNLALRGVASDLSKKFRSAGKGLIRLEKLNHLVKNYEEAVDKLTLSNRKVTVKATKELLKYKEKESSLIKKFKKDIKRINEWPHDEKNIETLNFPPNLIEGFKIMIKYLNNGMFRIRYGEDEDKYYAWNVKKRTDIAKLIKKGLITKGYGESVISTAGVTSDNNMIVEVYSYNEITIQRFIPTNKYKKAEGKFFPYYNTTNIDLTRYQIFGEDDDRENYTDTCLIYALKKKGINEQQTEFIKTFIKNMMIPRDKLNDICIRLKIRIELTTYIKKEGRSRKFGYGEEGEVYEIGLIEKHYFLNEKVNFTSYFIKNYNELKNVEGSNKYCKLLKKENRYMTSNTRFITSYELINLMLKQNLFTKITTDNGNVIKSQYYRKVEDEESREECLEYDSSTCVEYKGDNYVEKSKDDYVNVFFDFETFSAKYNNFKHMPYLVRGRLDNGSRETFYGKNCGYKFLEWATNLKKKVRLIAHNAKYDLCFIQKYLNRISKTERGNSLICARGIFNKTIIEIKDSYNLISMPLSKFGATFNLKVEKEVMPYDLLNEEGVIKLKNNGYHQVYTEIERAKKYLNDKDYDQFVKNINKWGLNHNGTVDLIRYSAKYCEIDCEVLRKGYNTFKNWINNDFKINIDQVATMASLADLVMTKEGVYKGVAWLSGKPSQFLQKCVVGGRNMCAENKKILVNTLFTESGAFGIPGKEVKDNYVKYLLENDVINDFDAVSLYPSAMARMKGYPIGAPKVLKIRDYNEIVRQNYDAFFVKVKVLEVNKKYKFPLQSVVDKEKGVRNFTNDLQGKILYLDNIALEDFIKFQDAKVEVLQGYYFNNGVNNKINKIIKYMFNLRLEKKKEKNPSELVYKLMMNSAYGKTLLKAVDYEDHYFDNEDKKNVFFSRNYNYIHSEWKIEDTNKYIIKTYKVIDSHFNRPQCGTLVLSWSKRIMNEVMTLAEDIGLDIYYQDTDSMHLPNSHINKLADAYRTKYNVELIGKNLGQFHSDFSLDGAKGEVFATKSIFLGKKCYYDLLESVNDKGEKINGSHIRLKGVGSSTVEKTAKKNNTTVNNIYEKMFNGEEISFNLAEGKPVFKFDRKNGTVYSNNEFIRNIKF